MRAAVLLMLLVIACGDEPTGDLHEDTALDCRSAFGEGPVECGPGADITSVHVDDAGPIVVTIELSEQPHYDVDFQWLVEFSLSDLACGLTNSEGTGTGFVGSDLIGPYGYRVLTGETAPAGTCDGELDDTTATIVFNVQPPLGPWTLVGGTQYVEIANLSDNGSADDVAVEVPTK